MSKRIKLSEQQLLKYFYTYPDSINEEFDFFLSDEGSAIFNALLKMYEIGVTPTKTDLLKYALDYKSISEDAISFLETVEIHKDNFVQYLLHIKGHYVRDQIDDNELADFTAELGKKKPDYDVLFSLLDQIQLKLQSINSNFESEEYFLNELAEIEEYKTILERRKEGESYPSGDIYLDTVLYNRSFMPGEISILFGHSGSGKTTYAKGLIERRRLRRLPTLDITIEMGLEATLDAKMSSRLKMDRSDLTMNYELTEDEEFLIDKPTIFSNIIDKVDLQKRNAKRSKTYIHINTSSMSFSKLDKVILKSKKAMGLAYNDYLYVCIDLLTQMKEFNSSRAGKTTAGIYEEAMNELSEKAKRHNVHIMGVVQAKRSTDKLKIKTPDDVEKLRVNTEDLKNSAAIEERARLILGVFRRMHFVRKYLPEDPSLKYEDDILDITILKQNNYRIGDRLYYLFNPERSMYYKIDWNPYEIEKEGDLEEEDDI